MMTIGPVELTSRDIAALFWWGLVIALVVGLPAARSSAGGVLQALLRLAGILLLLIAWVALLATRIPFLPSGGAVGHRADQGDGGLVLRGRAHQAAVRLAAGRG